MYVEQLQGSVENQFYNLCPKINDEFMLVSLPFWSKVKCLGFGHGSLKFYKKEKKFSNSQFTIKP